MAVTPTHKVRITPVLREYFQALGADVKGWPKGWKQAVADRTGGTLNAIGSTRSRLARTWPTDGPHLEEVPDPDPPEPVTPKEATQKLPLADRHREILEASAITTERMTLWRSVERVEDLPDALERWGEKAVPCMATEWLTVGGRKVAQIRLDNPIPDRTGRPHRYLFEVDAGGIVGVDAAFEDRWKDPNTPALLVEGTKQFQAAASTIPPLAPFAVPFGIAGCWGWSQDFQPSVDLRSMPVEGRDVFVAFDADITTNWMVWEAARRLERYLTRELLARSVRFVINPGVGGAKDGLDDLLGRQQGSERRIRALRHLLDTAIEHKAIKPAPKKPSRKTGFFDGSNFMPASCLAYLRSEHHLAMSGDQSVAVYHQGVYWNGLSLWWTRLITDTLQNDYKPEFEASVTKMALAWLKTEKRSIPFQQQEPVINFQNGLLDAQILELREHTHEHLSLVQWPWNWDPKAECPVFLEWIEAVAPGQLESLLDVCSQMLDLSQWPGLMVFLTGPTRSGKSTWIRILCALVGPALRSNVSLHDLSSGKDLFASSSLFGKVLNTFADLSSNDLQDLSLIKVLTGGDEFEAQRKNNHRFTMRNQAMLVFSANSVPAASEQSNALLTRVAHFEFPYSFAGAEDPSIEKHILENELPGVLRLLVQALHKRRQRGRFLPLDKDRQRAFAEKTDRVRMFLAESTRPGDRSRQCILKSALFQDYRLWVADNLGDKAIPLGKHKFNERVRLSGVELFTPKGGSETWNLLPGGGENTDTEPSKPPTGGQTAVNELNAANGRGISVTESAVSEPKTPTKTTDTQTADGEAVLEDSKAPGSAKSVVHPYFSPSEKKQKKVPKSPQWVETTETPDSVLPSDDLIRPGSADPLVVDLETRSASELWATPNGSGPFIRLVGTDHGNNTDPSQLLDHTGPLVAHNGFGFDFLSLARHHDLPLLELSESGRLMDTMVLALVLDPPADGGMSGGQLRRYYSLDNCATRAGIEGKTDDLGKLARSAAKDAGYKGKPSELQALGYGLIPQADPDYNAYLRGDIAAGRGVFDALVPTGELDDYSRREMRVMGRLAAGITLAGTRLDVELTRKRFDQIEQAKAACWQILVEKFGLPTTTATGRPAKNPLNCTGASEAITAAAKALGLELPTTTKTGKPSTSKDNLGPLLEQAKQDGNDRQAAFLETILGLTGARSVYGTALDHLQSDGMIHPTIAPLQTSGRFSITQPGITVFGKRGGKVVERAIFLPDADDHVLIAADLSQIDMRAIAAHAQDPAYLELFAPGRDAHSEVAAAVGLTRSDAKAIGHGWNYGMSVKGMIRHGIEEAKAVQFDRGMRRSFPTLCRWRDRVRDRAEHGHKLDNGFGRLMKANPQRAYTQAPALMGQGTARDLMMEAVLRLPLWLVPQLRFLVHDELVFSVPRNRWITAGKEILRAMTFEWAPPGASLSIRVTGDLSRPGRNWADCYEGTPVVLTQRK